MTCDNCKHRKKDWTNSINDDTYCANTDSENYGYNTMYLDECEDGEEKE